MDINCVYDKKNNTIESINTFKLTKQLENKSTFYDINKINFVILLRSIIFYNCYLKTLVYDVEVYDIKKYISSIIKQLSLNQKIKVNFIYSENENFPNTYIIYNRRIESTKLLTQSYDESIFNGIIITEEGKVICSPPRSFIIKNYDMVKSIINENNYKAYIALDGTIFNLYYSNSWHISTAKGCLMDNKTLFGKTPLLQLIKNILIEKGSKLFIELNENTILDNFDRNLCYTFRLSSEEWNLGIEDNYKDIVFINAKNLTTFENYSDVNILPSPLNKIIKFEECIPLQQAIQLYKQSRNINQFKRGFTQYIPNFAGIILRAKNNSYKDIFLESSRMELLRTYLYSHIYKTRNIKQIALQHYFKIFDHNLLVTIGNIYDKFKIYFKYFDNEFNKLVNIIISKLKGDKKLIENKEYDVASTFLIEQSILGNINGLKDFRLEQNIKDIIKNQTYIPIYVSLWCD
jgi:hypothetical protein